MLRVEVVEVAAHLRIPAARLRGLATAALLTRFNARIPRLRHSLRMG